jgi:Holliday junction resolvase-like predicted endonuclease
MQKKEIFVKKLDGTMEPFNEAKLRVSLERSGASSETVNNIVLHINKELTEGMTTSHIYKHAFEVLKKKEKTPAARYSLKRAVMELGPTGFPFERFIGEILKIKGYKITLGMTLEGACAEHEIDVMAEKDNEIMFIEAKFHNQLSIKSDLKVVLYVQARYADLEKNNFAGRLKDGQKHSCRIITNTGFTKNASEYGKCVNMKVTGWDHPIGESLQDLIEETALHPLTCLTSLSESEKNNILKTGNVLCRDIRNNSDVLSIAGIDNKKHNSVLEEIGRVCVPR